MIISTQFWPEYNNIGFGSLSVDACSNCMILTESMKNCKDVMKKWELNIKQVYNIKADFFYKILRTEKEGTKTMAAFDC